MTNSSARRTEKDNDQQESSKKWIDLINESVHTSDDIDIGSLLR